MNVDGELKSWLGGSSDFGEQLTPCDLRGLVCVAVEPRWHFREGAVTDVQATDRDDVLLWKVALTGGDLGERTIRVRVAAENPPDLLPGGAVDCKNLRYGRVPERASFLPYFVADTISNQDAALTDLLEDLA